MKYSFYYLFFIGFLFISCNKGAFFFSEEDESDVVQQQPYIPPHKEQPISLDGQRPFIELAAADIRSLTLPESRPIDVPMVHRNEGESVVPSRELSPLPSIVVGDVGADKMDVQERGAELGLQKGGKEPLVFSVTKGEGPRYPTLPQLALKSGAEKPNEVLIPENTLTYDGQRPFIELAAADIKSLNLSESRPIDVSIVPRNEGENVVPSRELSPLPSVVVGDVGADRIDVQERGAELGLQKGGKEPLVFSVTKGEGPRYPTLPQLALKSGAEKPNEVLIPENTLTYDGQRPFIKVAAADIKSLNLSESRPIDVSIVPRNEGENVVPSRELSPLSSVVVGDVGADRIDVQEGGAELGLQEGRKEPLVFSITDGEEPEYPSPSLAQLVLNIEESAPEEVFIPQALDFLFVIDTSESMREHLISFREKFAKFLMYFSNFSWRLAITNADHGQHGFFLFNIGALKGEVIKLERDGSIINLRHLSRRVRNYNQIFLDSISRHRIGEYKQLEQDGWEYVDHCDLPPYCQGPNEQPLKALKAALGKNPDFFREDADLVAVVVSNSKEGVFNAESSTQPEEVIEQFRKIHGDEKRFKVYGIVILEDDVDCLEQNNAAQFLFPEGAFSERIARLSEMTGGAIFNICSQNYEELSHRIFQSFGRDRSE